MKPVRVKDDAGKMAGAHARGSVVLLKSAVKPRMGSSRRRSEMLGTSGQCSTVSVLSTQSARDHDVQGGNTVWVKHPLSGLIPSAALVLVPLR